MTAPKAEAAYKSSLGAGLAGLARLYKYLVSPMLAPACRFHPTCSEYAADAFEKYGPVVGCLRTAFRLLRCNPWCRGGFDPA